MNKIIKLVIILLLVSGFTYGQEKGYSFTIKKELPCTPVKSQASSSTCWCFSGISVMESELLSMDKGTFDLSEMYIVRHTYEKKAEMYARMHGNANFGGGSEFGDVIEGSREVGLVPETAYPGLNYGTTSHNHREMDGVLKGFMEALVKNRSLTTAWMEGINGILDAYLGEMSSEFLYEGKTYTPASFMKELGLDPDDYICLTSFTHHPFYEPFVLELPDNWAAGLFYNLPLDEFMQVIDNAISTGYTVGWASDVSDRGFSMTEGVAIVPQKDWSEMSEDEVKKAFEGPLTEKVITQEMRQKDFDNYSTTDDHGMQIMGIATDQEGNSYYKVKNSWGITGKYDGYLFVSKPFVALKTTNIMVNKNAIPDAIAKKLGVE
jgi:bleomycin hydrolase